MMKNEIKNVYELRIMQNTSGDSISIEVWRQDDNNSSSWNNVFSDYKVKNCNLHLQRLDEEEPTVILCESLEDEGD